MTTSPHHSQQAPHPQQQPQVHPQHLSYPQITPPLDPRAQAAAAKAIAKAHRPLLAKKRVWALGAAAIVVVGAAIGGGGGDDNATPPAGNEPASTAPTASGSALAAPGDQSAAPKAAPTKAAPTKAAPTKAASPKAEPAAVKVSAGTLLKAFEENEAAADQTYIGKKVEVSGIVGKVDTDIWNKNDYIVQVGSGGEYEFLFVNCGKQPSSVAAGLKVGQKVTVVGTVDDGGDLGVELSECTVK